MTDAAGSPGVIEAAREVMSRFERIERALTHLAEPDRVTLAEDVAALRKALHQLEGLEREARHQFEHDLRVPLNTIAGWTHILRADASASDTVARAVDVFDRNVRTLTRILETYTAEVERSRASANPAGRPREAAPPSQR